MIKDRQFSDLIVLSDGRGFLKGTPEAGQNLLPVEGYNLQPFMEAIASASARDQRFRITIDGIIYRVALYNDVQQGSVAFLRRLPEQVPSFDRLGLPPVLVDWLLAKEQQKGLVLFAGPQASGKTTSAASFIDARIHKYGGHMVSFESPVEMPLSGPAGLNGYCFQGEIEEKNLGEHIKQSYRYGSPDILYIGELLDAFSAAQTLRASLGSSRQLVVTSIHGLSIVGALDRLLTWAREADGPVASVNLAHSLLAIVFQELDHSGGRIQLKVPELLCLPFTDRYKGIRTKLRDGNLQSLQDDIKEQRNRMAHFGADFL